MTLHDTFYIATIFALMVTDMLAVRRMNRIEERLESLIRLTW